MAEVAVRSGIPSRSPLRPRKVSAPHCGLSRVPDAGVCPGFFVSGPECLQTYLEVPDLPRTIEVLGTMCDMRILLTFDEHDCRTTAQVVSATAREVTENR